MSHQFGLVLARFRRNYDFRWCPHQWTSEWCSSCWCWVAVPSGLEGQQHDHVIVQLSQLPLIQALRNQIEVELSLTLGHFIIVANRSMEKSLILKTQSALANDTKYRKCNYRKRHIHWRCKTLTYSRNRQSWFVAWTQDHWNVVFLPHLLSQTFSKLSFHLKPNSFPALAVPCWLS